jgi:chromosomal replication initiation ATPase DnaA
MNAAQILEEVSVRYSLPISQITGVSQQPHLVPPRTEIARALREKGWSFPRIAKFLGGRHHSSVMYYLNKGRKPLVIPPAPFDPDVPDLSGEWAI